MIGVISLQWKIPLFKIYWDEHDVENVTDIIKSGMYWAEGPSIQKFESLISEYIGSKYCVTFNSGTSAQHAAMLAHGIREGDEVIVPSFTFISTANAPLFVGAKPIFADIEEETFGLDPNSVVEKISDKTKAIMPIHYGGCPCKIKELREIADDHGLILIEDAAEALGASIGNQKVGTFGDSGMLSFCQNKIITTGEGGALVTDSKEIYQKLKLIRSHGRRDDSQYFISNSSMDYASIGYNFRMSSITASLGVSQINKADEIIGKRRENANLLTTKLKKLPEDDVFTLDAPNSYYNVYQLYTIRAKGRNELKEHLTSKGIMSKIYFPPVHLTHFYKNCLKYSCDLPTTDHLAEEVLTLPMYPQLTSDEIDYIIKEIKNYYGEDGYE